MCYTLKTTTVLSKVLLNSFQQRFHSFYILQAQKTITTFFQFKFKQSLDRCISDIQFSEAGKKNISANLAQQIRRPINSLQFPARVVVVTLCSRKGLNPCTNLPKGKRELGEKKKDFFADFIKHSDLAQKIFFFRNKAFHLMILCHNCLGSFKAMRELRHL